MWMIPATFSLYLVSERTVAQAEGAAHIWQALDSDGRK
jgi:hypothetical protein